MFQVHGDTTPVSEGKWNLHSSVLLCSYPICRINLSDFKLCLYKEEQDIHSVIVSRKGKVEDSNNEYGLKQLNIDQLKEKLKARYLMVSRNKSTLIKHFKSDQKGIDIIDETAKIAEEGDF